MTGAMYCSKKIAEMLKGFIRKEDILTRYGDEEFIVLLPNTPEENAFIFAERFRREIEKMEFIPAGEEERHPITISGGIASYPFLQNVEEDGNTLIRYAEHALYNAKKTRQKQNCSVLTDKYRVLIHKKGLHQEAFLYFIVS